MRPPTVKSSCTGPAGCRASAVTEFTSTKMPMPAAFRWDAVRDPAAFAPRDGGGAVSFRGRMWLLGGWNPERQWKPSFPRVCNSEVWSSVDGAEWRLEVRQAPWEGRHCAGCVVHGDKMWVVAAKRAARGGTLRVRKKKRVNCYTLRQNHGPYGTLEGIAVSLVGGHRPIVHRMW